MVVRLNNRLWVTIHLEQDSVQTLPHETRVNVVSEGHRIGRAGMQQHFRVAASAAPEQDVEHLFGTTSYRNDNISDEQHVGTGHNLESFEFP